MPHVTTTGDKIFLVYNLPGGIMTHVGATLPLAQREALHRQLYQELLRKAIAAGLTKPHDSSFYKNCCFVMGFIALDLWVALDAISGIWTAVATGALWGITYGWLGQLGHDAGHGQAPQRSKKMRVLCQLVIGNLLIGFSKDWWITKHNFHHEFPNVLGVDPDPNTPVPLYAQQARERGLTTNSFVVKNAAWIFPLLLPLQAINARRSSFQHLYKTPTSPRLTSMDKIVEITLLSLHLALYATLVVAIAKAAGIGSAVAFVLVHQGTHGIYNAFVFATNHKGKAVFNPGEATWLELQILTSANIYSGEGLKEKVITWTYGGLNYQIEHHLFPKMSRRNLRLVRPLVIEFCREYGFEYDEKSILACYRRVWRGFETVRLDLLDSPMGA